MIDTYHPPYSHYLDRVGDWETGANFYSEPKIEIYQKVFPKNREEGDRVKTTEKKAEFIALRAEGLSYSKIVEKLHISKSTCTKWERDLQAKIRTAKGDRLEELYSLYRLGKEEYIKKLGEQLQRIDTALAEKDFSEVPTEKLLRLKLEYEEKLQSQRIETGEEAENFTEYSTEEMLEAVVLLYGKIKAGKVTAQKARTELATLEEIRKAISEKNAEW